MKFAILCMTLLLMTPIMSYPKLRDSNEITQNCILNIIRQFFKEDETLCFVTGGSFDLFRLSELHNPYVILNLRKSTNLQLNSGRNFIIVAENSTSLSCYLRNLERSAVWNELSSPKGKFLIITYSIYFVRRKFHLLWELGIIDVIIICRSYIRSPTIYMANPFENGNDCGEKTPSVIHKQSCDSKLVKLVHIPIQNLRECGVYFYWPTTDVTPFTRVLNFLLTELVHSLNGTLYQIVNEGSPKFTYELVLGTNENKNYRNVDISEVIYQQNWVWITPEKQQIYPADTVLMLLEGEVWILTGLTFFVILNLWWILIVIKTNTSKFYRFCYAFIDIISLTLGGTISLIPNRKMLRYLFIIYSMYVLLIHTAFKTNFIQALTLPHFTNRITSAEQLVDLKFTVYSPYYNSSDKYKIILDDDKLKNVPRLKKLLKSCEIAESCLDSIYVDRNSAMLLLKIDQLILSQGNNTLEKLHVFTDNYALGNEQMVFGMKKGHYFLKNLNKLIATLKQSGIYDMKVSKEMILQGATSRMLCSTALTAKPDQKALIGVECSCIHSSLRQVQTLENQRKERTP
ncbi:hypothetical protein FQA39_LY00923 [Lamprigera yunnana]|nr:hypothetical protein FQA39_LY00923 [Lamprigera yunnana]